MVRSIVDGTRVKRHALVPRVCEQTAGVRPYTRVDTMHGSRAMARAMRLLLRSWAELLTLNVNL